MVGKRDQVLQDFRDEFEYEIKGANYLLIAHGAGLLGFLSLLKDYKEIAQLRGMGIFFGVFRESSGRF